MYQSRPDLEITSHISWYTTVTHQGWLASYSMHGRLATHHASESASVVQNIIIYNKLHKINYYTFMLIIIVLHAEN